MCFFSVASETHITMCMCSNLKPLLDNLGLYFQIRDDYANLYSMEVRTALSLQTLTLLFDVIVSK